MVRRARPLPDRDRLRGAAAPCRRAPRPLGRARRLMLTILSLCDYTGEWSKPYREAGYDVRQVDIQRGEDVRLFRFCGPIRGVLAAPPCTHFARSGARHWKNK